MQKPILLILLVGICLASTGCDQLGLSRNSSETNSAPKVQPTSFQVRAQRRAFDGAPPVIPHQAFGPACTTCHTAKGKVVPTVGIAPANPHVGDLRAGSLDNCKQCHLFSQTNKLFVEADFVGLKQKYSPAERAHKLAPPVIPHSTNMRANCMACHGGQAARPEIVCSHPERTNCVQCHVEIKSQTPALGFVTETSPQ